MLKETKGNMPCEGLTEAKRNISWVDLKLKRTFEYKPQIVIEGRIKCIKCGKPAEVTFYNEDWDKWDLCKSCWESV